MPVVRVWNDNVHPYKEEFRGKQINIPPKSFILMDEGDAHTFKGEFAPIVRNADGVPIPEGFKMIRIAPHDGPQPAEAPAPESFVCNVCRYAAANGKDLSEHEKSHASQLVKDDEAEAEIKRRKKAG